MTARVHYNASALLGEDEEAFLLRRTADEQAKVASTSCLVRAVHEEMIELYDERIAQAFASAAELEALAAKITSS